MTADHDTVGLPLGTKCKRIVRLARGWRVWLATDNYIYGSYLELYDDGRVTRTTTRDDEGDDVFLVRPSDAYIRKQWEKVL